jgi:hypothetical protein
MTWSIFLQAFLAFDIFLVGVVAAIAAQHAFAHFRPQPRETEKPHYTPQTMHLPPAIKEQMIQESKANFKVALDRSAVELQHELKATTNQLNEQLEKLGREVFSHEMERYRLELDQLRKRADMVIGGAQSEIAEHQAEIRAKLAAEIAAEKLYLTQQMDAKLADAIASFMVETLGHNADLGAQTPYLMATLEEHKAELIREVVQ